MDKQRAIDVNEQEAIRLPQITREQVLCAGGTLLASGAIDLAVHFNPAVVLTGIFAAYAVGKLTPEVVAMLVPGSNPDQVIEALENLAPAGPQAPHPDQSTLAKLRRLVGIKTPAPAQPKEAQEREDNPSNEDEQDQSSQGGLYADEASLFAVKRADDTGGVKRFTIDQICKHIEPNSYNIYIGRSLTLPGNPATMMRIYKRHFRFMGASQRGKSSMVAAFLDIVTRTHDKKHVQLVLLDKEDQTSKLFAHLPHIVKIKIGEDLIKLHARTNEQVLEYLTYVVMIMNQRYGMSKSEVFELPLILVYIEEFLSLKNFFKAAIDRAKGAEAKAKAIADYKTLVYCIEEIAQRGLKVFVQLLLCAQVEYADDDFKEALVNIDCGMAFCVRPTAAASAGFRNTALINRNAKENKVGQAVVETPDVNDLVLAPDYDLEKRLVAFEKAEAGQQTVIDRRDPQIWAGYGMPTNGTGANSELETGGRALPTGRPETALNEPVETRDAHPVGGMFHPKGDDKLLTDEQADDLEFWYGKMGNLIEALTKIGLTNSRYRRHAAWILEQRGLKRRA